MTTFWQHFDNVLTTFFIVHGKDNILTTFWQRFDNILTTFWQHFPWAWNELKMSWKWEFQKDNILTTFWQHFDNVFERERKWQRFDNILTTFWQHFFVKSLEQEMSWFWAANEQEIIPLGSSWTQGESVPTRTQWYFVSSDYKEEEYDDCEDNKQEDDVFSETTKAELKVGRPMWGMCYLNPKTLCPTSKPALGSAELRFPVQRMNMPLLILLL